MPFFDKEKKLEFFYKRDKMLFGVLSEQEEDWVLFAQDREESKGSKVFGKFPIQNLFGEGFHEHKIDEFVRKNNHLYEILPPGKPVKMYFDLEIEKAEFDKATMVSNLETFLGWLLQEIESVFGHRISREKVAVLDSCRENKLSYHVIVNDSVYFESVFDQKKFVAYLWKRFHHWIRSSA